MPFPSARIPWGGQARGYNLSFADRVAYQYAIEEVYWRHRIWPLDNPGLKPSLDKVISPEQIQGKVADYLRKSEVLAEQSPRAITPADLQAEIDRMASQSKQPDVLRELFAALGNDPYVIAECLARPILAERLIAESKSHAKRASFRAQRSEVEESRSTTFDSIRRSLDSARDDTYTLPQISVPDDCANNTWTATTTLNAPDGRFLDTALWTGSEMIIWGGANFSPPTRLNTGGRYDPATDRWSATSTVNAPTGRNSHTAVWTGSEMIVWGGETAPSPGGGSGGRYNPVTDTWTATSITNAPAERASHSAVWSGSEMIVWGGSGCGSNCNLSTGGRYSPTTDTWTATSVLNTPIARFDHTALWTGSEMIVWGGTDRMTYQHTGGRYNPATDSWTPTSLVNAPLGRVDHTAVWTGSEMIVWGGVDNSLSDLDTGGRYAPTTDSWTATSFGPSPRAGHTAVWTGTEMIVWGGFRLPA